MWLPPLIRGARRTLVGVSSRPAKASSRRRSAQRLNLVALSFSANTAKFVKLLRVESWPPVQHLRCLQAATALYNSSCPRTIRISPAQRRLKPLGVGITTMHCVPRGSQQCQSYRNRWIRSQEAGEFPRAWTTKKERMTKGNQQRRGIRRQTFSIRPSVLVVAVMERKETSVVDVKSRQEIAFGLQVPPVG